MKSSQSTQWKKNNINNESVNQLNYLKLTETGSRRLQYHPRLENDCHSSELCEFEKVVTGALHQANISVLIAMLAGGKVYNLQLMTTITRQTCHMSTLKNTFLKKKSHQNHQTRI